MFDLFYKLPALQQNKVKIHLHCFEYGRGQQEELNKHCESVHYYKRVKGPKLLSRSLPYIVSSRASNELINSLLEDNYPILMEGVHCTFLLTDERFAARKCFVRLHNVEHIYYKHLFNTTSSLLKKAYYWFESRALYRYEKQISNKAFFLAVSETDIEEYKKLGCKNVAFMPLFLPPWKVEAPGGKGSFCLYQGHLAVDENEKAALWLLRNVFDRLDIPFVIAGKNPSHRLSVIAERKNNTCLVANPAESEMQDLISKAHINIVPSFNATGIKLKLINVLYNGRHCIVNSSAVEGTHLEAACHIADTAEKIRATIAELYPRSFDEEDMEVRHHLLKDMFNNSINATKLVGLIWDELS